MHNRKLAKQQKITLKVKHPFDAMFPCCQSQQDNMLPIFTLSLI